MDVRMRPRSRKWMDQLWVRINGLFDLLTLGIQSPSEKGFMEPKYLAFRRWLYTPIIIWQGEPGSLGLYMGDSSGLQPTDPNHWRSDPTSCPGHPVVAPFRIFWGKQPCSGDVSSSSKNGHIRAGDLKTRVSPFAVSASLHRWYPPVN